MRRPLRQSAGVDTLINNLFVSMEGHDFIVTYLALYSNGSLLATAFHKPDSIHHHRSDTWPLFKGAAAVFLLPSYNTKVLALLSYDGGFQSHCIYIDLSPSVVCLSVLALGPCPGCPPPSP